MENESLLDQTDLREAPVTIENKDTVSSTVVGDDRSIVDTKKEASAVEIMEETASFFVVEESGVIHLKTKRVLKMENSAMVFKDRKGDGATADGKNPADDEGAEASQDCKKEDATLQNNETSIADTYLQLDVTDNLDVYLERERVRKLNLSKRCDEVDNESALKKADPADKESSGEGQNDDSSNKNRLKTDSCEHKVASNSDENSISLEETEITVKTADTEIKTADSNSLKSNNAFPTNKSEQGNSDKKDNRFIWVSNVSKGTKATDLKMHLVTHGKVQLAKIVTDGKDCFGYVVMESHEDVVNCMNNLQNSTFENKEITLSDRMPERKHNDKPKDPTKDNVEDRKSDKKKRGSQGPTGRKEAKSVKSDHRQNSDPLTLKVADSKQRGYSEERRRIETLERKRLLRERESMERREVERRRRELEREREREHQRERERELRKRERMEAENQRQAQLKLDKERRKLEFEKKMIEKQKIELMRYKRKLFSKEKENARVENKKRRTPPEDFDRKKYGRVEEHGPKHSAMDMTEGYWKAEKVKSPPSHDIYNKKNNQEMCVAPPPPILSSNYHATPERPRSSDRDRQWYERKEYDHRMKSYGRKPEDNRNYLMTNDARQPYQEKTFSKEQYKHKDYQVVQSHNSWDGFPQSGYKDQTIPLMRNEQQSRSMPRHPGYQEGPFGGPSPQDYYPGSNYRRVNDYYNRPVERKY